MTWILRDGADRTWPEWNKYRREDDEFSANGSVAYVAGDGYGDGPADGQHDPGAIDNTRCGWGTHRFDGFQKTDGSGNSMHPPND
jgi:hypothetical protein